MQIKIDLDFHTLELKRLLDTLAISSRYYPRLVGGSVRDKLLHRAVTDIDINTDSLPEEVIKTLSTAGIKVIATGLKFGTVTALINKQHFEITTLRRDIECYGRGAKVEYCDDFYIDAQRRDFTINAMSYDLRSQILYDYFQGLENLQAKKVIFIGDPLQRIEEDFLRIMRFFRFSALYAESLDEEGLNACIFKKDKLNDISTERVNSEFSKIINNVDSIKVLQKMQDIDILNIIFPNIILNIDALNKLYNEKEQRYNQCSLDFKYALLLSNNWNRDIVFNSLKKFKFSNKQQFKIKLLLELQFMEAHKITAQLYKIWNHHPEELVECIIFCKSLNLISLELFDEMLELSYRLAPKFPLKAQLLMDIGYEGRALGVAMKYLEEKWLETSCSLNTKQLLTLLKQ